jgi:hypothetical protein
MHRVVILEDAQERIDWFRERFEGNDWAATASVKEFLRFVGEAEQAGTLKLIIMDHDLGHPSPPTGLYGSISHEADVDGFSGADAADYLTTTAPVLIWSANEYGARNIELILKDKGIQTARLSFYSHNFTAIVNIINKLT